MNIYLIGYRCTGKTTIGRRIAAALNRPFEDTDAAVVRTAGISIARIVAKYGWPDFRRREKAVLRKFSEISGGVIATGGGVILDAENRLMMKKNGTVIWLRATPETIYRRMLEDRQTEGQRPGLTDKSLMDEIVEMVMHRKPLYENAADAAIDTDTPDINAIRDRCLDMVEALHYGEKE